MAVFPHDLQHLAIEGSLQLRRGFWGTIDEGGVFGTMTHLDGRRKPHAARRSKEVLKANHDEISEAELLVAIVGSAIAQCPKDAVGEARRRLKRHGWTRRRKGPRSFSDEDLDLARRAWNDLRERWHSLAIGDALEFRWPTYFISRGQARS